MAVFGTLTMIASVILRIVITIYLYSNAKNLRFPAPGLWILMGIYKPIAAVMLFYVLRFIRDERRNA
ncbi:MAG: hypothetical protein GX101_05285 [Firmicutes bacterium]|jgi:Na+-driven multidrug efflux pump|nr:hypothetical protein [Bacillota bacterium]NLO66086.1 hypothetical protein [Bacillota bacterium]